MSVYVGIRAEPELREALRFLVDQRSGGGCQSGRSVGDLIRALAWQHVRLCSGLLPRELKAAIAEREQNGKLARGRRRLYRPAVSPREQVGATRVPPPAAEIGTAVEKDASPTSTN